MSPLRRGDRGASTQAASPGACHDGMASPMPDSMTPARERSVPFIVDEDGERVSVTDANGSIARFEMTYEPPAVARMKFGPPMRARIPSAIYLDGPRSFSPASPGSHTTPRRARVSSSGPSRAIGYGRCR